MYDNTHYDFEKDIRNIILILDEDPRKSAKSLIRSHVMHYIPILQKIFIQYSYKKEEETQYIRSHTNMWINYMKRSRQNFLWVVYYYKTLQEIFKNTISKREEYYKSPKVDFNDSYLELDKSLPNGRHEICLYNKHINKYQNNKIKYKKLKENFVNTNRMTYLKANYPEHMFPNSRPPKWYNKINKTHEFENTIDNMDIRIITNSLGNYRYFCKIGLSDIWIEIKNVPSDMRFIMNAILLK